MTMTAPAVDSAGIDQSKSRDRRAVLRRWLPVLGAGVLAGLTAALFMTVVMGLLRWGAGISPPPEAVPDRLAPTIKIREFFKLINDYGGYNGLKRFGVWTGIRAMIGAGTGIGLLYAIVTEAGRSRNPSAARWGIPRLSWLFIGIALAAVWGGTLIFLWSVLGANYRGLPPSTARPVAALGLLLGYLSFGIGLMGAYRFLTRPRVMQPAMAEAVPERGEMAQVLPRRALMTAVVGGALGVATYRLIKRLEDMAVFTYDGRRPRGTRLDAITPNEKFYVVTKNVIDPNIIKSIWRLEITGHVNDKHTYDFDELAALPRIDQEATLMCISNKVGDILISNAVWTGIPMATLLNAAGVKDGAVEVLLHSADGYTDTFAIEKALEPTTLVAIAMNGEELPDKHGFPARVVVPGLFGEKNAKWLTGIEVVDSETKGFYEKQGWGPSFVIPTRALFYVPELKNQFRVGSLLDLRGIAFAGNRGISKVEISLDDGKSWQPTTIDYAGTKLTWALWSYDWRPTAAGEFGLLVRATDGNGDLQTAEKRSIVSEGATGYHRVVAKIVA